MGGGWVGRETGLDGTQVDWVLYNFEVVWDEVCTGDYWLEEVAGVFMFREGCEKSGGCRGPVNVEGVDSLCI